MQPQRLAELVAAQEGQTPRRGLVELHDIAHGVTTANRLERLSKPVERDKSIDL